MKLIAEELKEFHEAEAAKLRLHILQASGEHKAALEKAAKLHEDKINAISGKK